MSPAALEALIDDYLRQVARTRPWTAERDEDALEAFAGWMRSRLDLPPSADPGAVAVPS